MLKYFKAKANPKDFNIDFVDENGQNCLHYAVSRNYQDFVRYILLEDKNNININQQT